MHRRLITRGYNLEPYAFNDSLIAAFWEVTGFEHADATLPSTRPPFFSHDFFRERPSSTANCTSFPLIVGQPVICHYIGAAFSKRSVTAIPPSLSSTLPSKISD